MNRFSKAFLTAAVAAIALTAAPAPALADDPVGSRSEAEELASFEADRADILAMAGDFKVTFDMKETTPWRDDYTPIKPKQSGGYESVRVIEDTGRKIVLQHLLVVGPEDAPFVVKHWRQDWEYEPEQILTYSAPGKWELEDVPEAMRKGRWSQTVCQVDDSPRYAGWGQWQTTNGVRRWRSNWTIRPLARRDATRDPVYDHYVSINRHQPFPGGWIHWQDNTKSKWVDGEQVPYVQESVLNTYVRFDGYPVSAADEYWKASADYWQAVRDEWEAALARTGAITVEEEAATGTVISGELLQMGTDLLNGEIEEAAAIAKAKSLIRSGTSAPRSAANAAGSGGEGY
ncbi:MAG: DUF6607 family protein [Pseudomonadota bacterium]|nr:DUF6607 family protein [Pseudomonadota bacterium]